MVDNFDERDPDSARSGILPESLRKALVTGMSAVFMTEDGIRGMLSDLRLPKEAMSYVVQQTDKSRKELFRIVAEELKSFLKNADFPGEIRRALSGLKVEVKAELRFVDESSTETSFKARVRDSDDDEPGSSDTEGHGERDSDSVSDGVGDRDGDDERDCGIDGVGAVGSPSAKSAHARRRAARRSQDGSRVSGGRSGDPTSRRSEKPKTTSK